MVAYHDYLTLSRSADSTERGQAAHYAASAFLAHDGPADEHAALYAAVMGFLDDPSVKVRAALAYGLLRDEKAPRAVMLALLHDAGIIARAVAQYSPVLLDADLLPMIPDADETMLLALAARQKLGDGVVRALYATGNRSLALWLLARSDIEPEPSIFARLVEMACEDARLRGALLDRADLPAAERLKLVDQVRSALAGARIVKGAVAPRRLNRILRDARNTALTAIGEREVGDGRRDFVGGLAGEGGLSTRLLMHALLGGRVQFFAAAISSLSGMPPHKVVSLLERGAQPVLAAAFARCGMGETTRDLLTRLVVLARDANLADDISARYFVVTVLIEDLIVEYGGQIPESLTDSFAYLNEQNIVLSRKAARGVMSSFAEGADAQRQLPMSKRTGQSLIEVA